MGRRGGERRTSGGHEARTRPRMGSTSCFGPLLPTVVRRADDAKQPVRTCLPRSSSPCALHLPVASVLTAKHHPQSIAVPALSRFLLPARPSSASSKEPSVEKPIETKSNQHSVIRDFRSNVVPPLCLSSSATTVSFYDALLSVPATAYLRHRAERQGTITSRRTHGAVESPAQAASLPSFLPDALAAHSGYRDAASPTQRAFYTGQ